MDPFRPTLPDYSTLPLYSEETFAAESAQRKLVLMYDLVVDYTNFSHPGYNQLIDQLQNKQIRHSYNKINHSENADFLICHLTVAKLHPSPLADQGQALWNKVTSSERYLLNSNALKKMDLTQPIMDEFSKLKPEQLQVLTEVPHYFPVQMARNMKLSNDQAKHSFNYKRFWVSNGLLWSYFVVLLAWLCTFSHYSWPQITSKLYFLAFGVFKWTFLEYYFHRFRLHYPLMSAQQLKGHLLHHAFPNLPDIIALNPWYGLTRLPFIAAFYLLFLDTGSVALIMIGLIGSMAIYDGLHYYCHFGPEINLWLFRFLRQQHQKHHFRNQDKDFGVTSPLWDWVFGTLSSNSTPELVS